MIRPPVEAGAAPRLAWGILARSADRRTGRASDIGGKWPGLSSAARATIDTLGLAVLVPFGHKKLPELARGLGEGMKELRNCLHGVSRADFPPEPPGPAGRRRRESR